MHHFKKMVTDRMKAGHSAQDPPDQPPANPPPHQTQNQPPQEPAPPVREEQQTAPPPVTPTSAPAPAAPGTLNIALVNNTKSSTVYAYLTGHALDKNNAIFLLQADGKTPYYPNAPSSILQPLDQNCAIPLGHPGNTVHINIPHIAGGRIWFSIEKPLVFLLNPGPALVEPSVTNPSDANINTDWGFCEFTFNTNQLYANISYVDFVSLPIALHLTTAHSGEQNVTGMPRDGLDKICTGLRDQHARDGKGWDKLIIPRSDGGGNLRALSPNLGMVLHPDLFQDYFKDYVDKVWSHFCPSQTQHHGLKPGSGSNENKKMCIDTQASFGLVTAQVHPETQLLKFNNLDFPKPSTRDIFTCSTGPFATGPDAQRNAIIPRLSAAFNRSTLLKTDQFPEQKELHYLEDVTNHYSRIVHEVNIDGRGYAFPYDDVQPSGGKDLSGEVHAGDPVLWTITVGGPS